MRGPYDPLLHRARRGRLALHRRRPQDPRRGRRRRGGQHRAGPRGNRATIAERRCAELNYIVPVWTSPRAREAGRSSRAMDSAGAHALLLHQRRIGGGRGGAQVRDCSTTRSTAARSRRARSSRAGSPITAIRSPRCRPAAACVAPTTSTCCSIGRRSIRRTATDARGARPIRRCDIDCADCARRRDPQARRRLDRGVYRRADDGIERRRRCLRSRSTGRRLREICDRYDVLLIADEVMTGFGRTGRRFAVDHWNVMPDILVGGKGLTGGYMPMGMIAVKESLVEEVRGDKARLHVLHLQLASGGLRGRRRRARNHGARAAGRARRRKSARGSARSSRKNCRGIRWSATFAAPGCSGASSWCATKRPARRIAPEDEGHESGARRGGSKRDCSSIRRPGWRGRRVATR